VANANNPSHLKPTLTEFLGLPMAPPAARAESKFLSLRLCNRFRRFHNKGGVIP
jgi:hypothetical protein